MVVADVLAVAGVAIKSQLCAPIDTVTATAFQLPPIYAGLQAPNNTSEVETQLPPRRLAIDSRPPQRDEAPGEFPAS